MEALFGAGFAGGRAVSPGAGPAGAGGGAGRKPEWKSVHLLSALEVKSLFRDVVEGLAFLVSSQMFWQWIYLFSRRLLIGFAL